MCSLFRKRGLMSRKRAPDQAQHAFSTGKKIEFHVLPDTVGDSLRRRSQFECQCGIAIGA
jgi:hypothetical protein